MYKVIVLFTLFTVCFGFAIEPKTHTNNRIVGGHDAVEGQFPWMISLRERETDQHSCGGSIINSKWILTAAHCFLFSTDPENYVIIAGSIFLNSGGVALNLSRIITHEDFEILTVVNDVAVVELAEELKFDDFIQPIELDAEFVNEVDCTISGWGRLYFNESLPNHLQYMNTRTITLEFCRQFPMPYPEIYVSDDELCTLSEEFAVCNGDSGGALVVDGKQIGIVSWGTFACAIGRPEVYARISAFIGWINTAISS